MDRHTKDLLFKYPKEDIYTIKYLDKTYVFDSKSKSTFDFISKEGSKEEYVIDNLIIKSDDTVKAVFVKFLMKTNISCLMNQICIMYENSNGKIKLLSSETTGDIEYRPDIEEDPEYDNIDRQGNITKLPVDISSRIMEDFDIKDNTFYFIKLEDWLQKHSDFDLKLPVNINGVIKKYWPYISGSYITNKYTTQQQSDIKQISDRYKEIFFNEFLRTLEVDKNIQNINEVLKEIKPSGFEFYHLSLRRDLDEIIDIKTLFNNMDLSDDIPVSMFHSDKFMNNRYKIFKDSLSNISLPQFREWRSGIELLPDVETIHYNPRKNTVTFHIKIKSGCFCVVDIYQEDKETGKGYIEITIDKSSMNKITFNSEDQFKTKISEMIHKINTVCLKECKSYVSDIELLDELKIGDFFNSRLKTKIVELGGKVTYSIKQNCSSETINMGDKISDNIKEYFPYLRVRENSPHKLEKRDTLLDKGTRYVYKRKSDYTKLDSIEAIIIPLISDKVQKGDIIRIILSQNILPLSYEEAVKIVDTTVENYLTDERKFKKNKVEKGISCRVIDEGEQIDIIFDSVNSELELKRLCLFNSVFLYDIYNNNSLLERVNDSKRNFLKKKSPKKKSPKKKSPKKKSPKQDKEIDESIAAKEEIEESNISRNSVTSSASSASSSASSDEEYAGGKYNKNRYHLNEIKRHDTNLVSFKSKNEGKLYVKKCPGSYNRHPYIVKDISQLERIEKRWKDNNFGNPKYPAFGTKQWLGNLLNFINDDTSSISWVRAGTSQDKLTIYICNIFWCLKCKSPLPDDYQSKTDSTNCPFCGCKYHGSIKQKPHEITDEMGTVIQRGAQYKVNKKGKMVDAWKKGDADGYWEGAKKSITSFVEPSHPDYYNTQGDFPFYLNMLPCCFKEGERQGSWKKYIHNSVLPNQIKNVEKSQEEKERIDKIKKLYPLKKTQPIDNKAIDSWRQVLQPATDDSIGNRGSIHPKLQRLFEFEDYINKLKKIRKPEDRMDLLNNEKLKGYFKRYGVQQNGTIWYSLAKILENDDSISYLHNLLKKVITKPLPFIQANNSQLVIEFKRPYSEFNNYKKDFVNWIKENSKTEKESKGFVNIYCSGKEWNSDSVTEEFVDQNKHKEYMRQLYNIYTAIVTYSKNIERMEYRYIMSLLSRQKKKDWKDNYICIFDIKDMDKKSKVEIIYPNYEEGREYKTISFINIQNNEPRTYEPMCYDPNFSSNNFKNPIFNIPIKDNKMIEKIYNNCIEKSKHDILTGTNNLPHITDTIIKKFIELYKGKVRYYTDSWCKTRYLIVTTDKGDLTLPVSPLTILEKQEGLEPLVYLEGVFPQNLNLMEWEDALKEMGTINKEVGIIVFDMQKEHIYKQKNKIVGLGGRENSVIFIKPLDVSGIPSVLKDNKVVNYTNEFEIEENIFFDTETKPDERTKYKEKEINESLMYKQYKKELAEAISQHEIDIILDLLDIDIDRPHTEDLQYYLNKMMWDSDKRDIINEIVEKLSDKHVTEIDKNPYETWKETKTKKRTRQRACDKTTKTKRGKVDKLLCNSKPLCQAEGNTCKLKIGGESYWTGKGLKNRFIEMLTNDIYYGGKISLDFLNNKISAPDPRLKILYKHSRNEYLLTGEETRDDYTMNKIFNINKSKVLSKSTGYYTGIKRERKGGGRRHRTFRKKRQQRTRKKKKNKRTFTKKIKKDKTLKNNIF